MPKDLLKQFGEEKPEDTKEEEDQKKAGEEEVKKRVSRVSRKKRTLSPLPKHDFVQPPFKKPSTNADAKSSRLDLRPSMLSAKLRERFSHLLNKEG